MLKLAHLLLAEASNTLLKYVPFSAVPDELLMVKLFPAALTEVQLCVPKSQDEKVLFAVAE